MKAVHLPSPNCHAANPGSALFCAACGYDFTTGESTDGNAVGHFTQVVWKSTTKVGCGFSTCGDNDLLVCNYSPAGNFAGQYLENVPPAK